MASILGQAGRIGSLHIPNRLIRSGTSESMGAADGTTDHRFERLHRDLALGGVGLQFTGHMLVEARGRYDALQVGIHDHRVLPPLRRAVEAVHAAGGRIFAQLGHAGSQSTVKGVAPIAPSAVPNQIHGRVAAAASHDDIRRLVDAFHAAALRAVAAGFDGIHLHGANGYLVSQFRSPLTNRRDDEWGGDATRREQLPLAIIEAVRAAVPATVPVTMKLGLRDIVISGGGLTQEVSAQGIARLVAAGLDGVEVSSNLMSDYVSGSIRQYVAVSRTRALADLAVFPLGPESKRTEAYFREDARALRSAVRVPIILVGGMRRADTVNDVLTSGDADFVSFARPFIREPDFARKLLAGKVGADCISCNICLQHDGKDSLRCWRVPRINLLKHACLRLARSGARAP